MTPIEKQDARKRFERLVTLTKRRIAVGTARADERQMVKLYDADADDAFDWYIEKHDRRLQTVHAQISTLKDQVLVCLRKTGDYATANDLRAVLKCGNEALGLALKELVVSGDVIAGRGHGVKLVQRAAPVVVDAVSKTPPVRGVDPAFIAASLDRALERRDAEVSQLRRELADAQAEIRRLTDMLDEQTSPEAPR